MSVAEILHEIEALPSEERLQLVEKLVRLTEANVPEYLRQNMAEAAPKASSLLGIFADPSKPYDPEESEKAFAIFAKESALKGLR